MMGYEVVAAAMQPGDDMGAQVNAGIQYLKNDMGGGKLVLPPGEHIIDTEIAFENNVWLAGSGREATVLKLGSGYSADNLMKGTSKNDVKISDMTLDANSQEKTLLRLDGCARASGGRLGFKNTAGSSGTGIRAEGGASLLSFRSLKFSSVGLCIFLNSSALESLFEDLQADSLCSKLLYAVGTGVKDCVLRSLLLKGLGTDIHLKDGPQRVLIDNLKSEQAETQSVYMEYVSSACVDITVINSEIIDASYLTPNTDAAIHIEANHSKVRIVNTRTINSNAKQKYGVLIDAGASECEIRGGKHEGVTAAWLNNGSNTLIDSRR